MNKRLSLQTVHALPDSVIRPNYDITAHKAGIVHIGIGAFHRGHQAVFTDDAIAISGGDWRITGVSLRSASVSEQMNPQDGLYTVTAKFNGKQETRLIGSVERVLVAPENPQSVIDLLASTQTKVVTLTVTEKGYHYDMSNHALLMSNADIQHDIAHPNAPVSMPGYIVAACLSRMQNSHANDGAANKLSVISCDNLPENGAVTKKVVSDLAAHHGEELVAWIKANVSFSSSMVDRIVPAVTQSDREACKAKLGMLDEAMIQTETFKQWVIEDNFYTPIPDWKGAGAILVENVVQYEKLKLRTLNGSHSALAYMGVLLGYKWIHEAISDPLLHKLIERLMETETGPSLHTPIGFDLGLYQEQIRARFLNDEIPYATQQVAMDGSQKIVQRILAPIIDNKEAKLNSDSILIAVLASWLIYLRGKDEAGTEFEIRDPLAEDLRKLALKYQASASKYIDALFTQTSIFPASLMNDKTFASKVVTAIEAIDEKGLKVYIQALIC